MKQFLIILLIVTEALASFCEGGPDPVCYFPDPEEDIRGQGDGGLSSVNHLTTTTKPTTKNTFTLSLTDDSYWEVIREVRSKKGKKKHEEGGEQQQQQMPNEGQSQQPGDNGNPVPGGGMVPPLPVPPPEAGVGGGEAPVDTTNKATSTREDPETPGPLYLIPLMEKDMAHCKLRQYPPQGSKERVYPPFTYNGFYAPAKWGSIPSWFFLPVTERKVGRYTGALISEKSGISFMTFSYLHDRHKKELEEMSPEDRDGMSEAEVVGGVSSLNCVNASFPAPLDIITAEAKEDITVVEFKVDNFDVTYGFVTFVPEDGSDLLFVKLQVPKKMGLSGTPSIEKGALIGNALYLDRISIHWGTSPSEGSEHRINGKSFGMELQFFFNTQDKAGSIPYWTTLERYMSENDPSQYGKHLFVLCLLVEVGPRGEKGPPPGKEYNTGLTTLGQAVQALSGAKMRPSTVPTPQIGRSSSWTTFSKAP